MIKLINVTKKYKVNLSEDVVAIDSISLDINEGDYIAIVGHSGAGKTTLLSMIGALIAPTSGEIYYNSDKLSKISSSRLSFLMSQKIGFIFQLGIIIPELNVIDNVLIPITFNKNQNYTEQKEYAIFLLNQLGLGSVIKRKTKNISGGEIQRVTIARALINRPEILLADEPTGEIDEKTVKIISALFSELNKKGLTIIMATHNSKFASDAKSVYRLENGRIVKMLK